jgi:hypothetical protein
MKHRSDVHLSTRPTSNTVSLVFDPKSTMSTLQSLDVTQSIGASNSVPIDSLTAMSPCTSIMSGNSFQLHPPQYSTEFAFDRPPTYEATLPPDYPLAYSHTLPFSISHSTITSTDAAVLQSQSHHHHQLHQHPSHVHLTHQLVDNALYAHLPTSMSMYTFSKLPTDRHQNTPTSGHDKFAQPLLNPLESIDCAPFQSFDIQPPSHGLSASVGQLTHRSDDKRRHTWHRALALRLRHAYQLAQPSCTFGHRTRPLPTEPLTNRFLPPLSKAHSIDLMPCADNRCKPITNSRSGLLSAVCRRFRRPESPRTARPTWLTLACLCAFLLALFGALLLVFGWSHFQYASDSSQIALSPSLLNRAHESSLPDIVGLSRLLLAGRPVTASHGNLARQSLSTVRSTSAQWYQDAVFYEVFVASYQDSDGDGLGDLVGLTSRLAYLRDLGVNVVRLNSILASVDYPLHYRQIVDHSCLDPKLGSLHDLRTLVSECARFGMSVVIDLDVTLTSDRHPWASGRQLPNVSTQDMHNIYVNTSDYVRTLQTLFVLLVAHPARPHVN